METEKPDRSPGEKQAHAIGLLCGADLNDDLTIILSAVQELLQMTRPFLPEAVQYLDGIGIAALRIGKNAGLLAAWSFRHGAKPAAMTMESRITEYDLDQLF